MSTLKTTLTGYAGYRGRQGHWGFLLHRITGLGTLLFLAIHIVSTAMVYIAPERYNEELKLYQTPLIMIMEIFLVFSVIFHGVNGLKIAIFDLLKPSMWKIEAWRKYRWAPVIIALILWLPTAAIMGYNVLRYGFKLIGGE